MFERLSAFFGARKERLNGQAEATKNSVVESIAKRQGRTLSLQAAPSPTHGGLTPGQFRAFESAHEVLLERMVMGASGLAPDFGELERMAISHIAASGWVQSAPAVSESPLAAHAAVAMLTGYDSRQFPAPSRLRT
jgi:hypothetical protein